MNEDHGLDASHWRYELFVQQIVHIFLQKKKTKRSYKLYCTMHHIHGRSWTTLNETFGFQIFLKKLYINRPQNLWKKKFWTSKFLKSLLNHVRPPKFQGQSWPHMHYTEGRPTKQFIRDPIKNDNFFTKDD